MEIKRLNTATSLEIRYDDGRVSHYDTDSITEMALESYVAKYKKENFKIFLTTISEVSMEEESD